MTDPADLRLLVGAYTATSGGHATGISIVDGSVAATAAVIDDPSFLAVTADRVFAVSETEDGGIHAFRRDGRSLQHLWDAASGGDAPCHIRIDASGALVVTNYVSGTVSAVSIAGAEARLAGALETGSHHHGDELRTALPDDAVAVHILPDVLGPIEDRQEGPHAHQSTATPWGTVLVADLGGDALHELRVTDEPSIDVIAVHRLAPGVGPRHMVWVDGDLVVTGELDGAVHRLRRDDQGTLVETTSAPAIDGPVGESLLSHVDVGPNGLVYAAVRGRDVVAVFDASDGGLVRIGSAPCGGLWPRHFAFAGDLLVVANQLSDELTVLPLGDDGVPGEPVARIPVGSPTCVVPLD